MGVVVKGSARPETVDAMASAIHILASKDAASETANASKGAAPEDAKAAKVTKTRGGGNEECNK